MKKISSILAYLILILTIGFNFWLNFPETKILADPNDNIFQYSLVYRTNWVWENYGCPLSLNCLPNLIDHVVTAWAEGYSLPFYYTHLPQIIIVSSYHLFIQPVISLFHLSYSLYQYYNLTKFLLLILFPLPIFFSLRLLGFSPLTSALSAFTVSNYSTDGLYGIDPPSFLWRGYGLTSQLYAIFFMPLGLSYLYLSLKNFTKPLPIFLTILFLVLTISGHLGIGMISLISGGVFVFLDLDPKLILLRLKRLVLIYLGIILTLSYWIVPILLYTNYHMISFWDPIWKFNSYGWYEVVRQFFQGEIFDWKRPAVTTYLVAVGFFTLLLDEKLFIFAVMFLLWVFMYFGRTTWGGLFNLIPGLSDFHLHRFIVGIQIASLFLLPAAFSAVFKSVRKLIEFTWDKIINLLKFLSQKYIRNPGERFNKLITLDDKTKSLYQNIIYYVLTCTFVSVLTILIIGQTIDFAKFNNRWIGEANTAYQYDYHNFLDLISYLKSRPNARVYAGRPGNWGKQMRLGSTEMYMLLGVNGFDMSQFLPETWSPLSETEQNFDERVESDYDLYNIRYIVASKDEGFTPQAVLMKTFGPFKVYEVPTSGWFDVVTSDMFVKSDKTNFLNVVHVWQKSYPRVWKSYPYISLDKNPQVPNGMKRILTMQDEVTYAENGKKNNIFADFPLTFPEATVSGKIIKESVVKQTYKATVEVPQNCKQCTILLKMNYHPDWTAKLDGQKVPTFAVFPFYLALQAGPGVHEVEFTYQPSRLKVILLWLEIIVLILLVVFRKRLKNLKLLQHLT